MNVLEVKFIGDEDALEHIVDKQEGMDDSSRMRIWHLCLWPLHPGPNKCLTVLSHRRAGVQSSDGGIQKMVTLKIPAGRQAREAPEQDGDENGHLDEQKYIQALGTDNTEGWLPSDLLTD